MIRVNIAAPAAARTNSRRFSMVTPFQGNTNVSSGLRDAPHCLRRFSGDGFPHPVTRCLGVDPRAIVAREADVSTVACHRHNLVTSAILGQALQKRGRSGIAKADDARANQLAHPSSTTRRTGEILIRRQPSHSEIGRRPPPGRESRSP